MGFTGVRFYIFAAAVVLVYYVLPKKGQWLVLLAASLGFYATYGLEMLPYMLASSVIAYGGGLWITKLQTVERDWKPAERKLKTKRVLLLCVAALVLLLAYAKVGTWVLRGVAGWLSLKNADSLKAIVALGVSYYTFSLISYLADIYWRRDQAEKNYFKLLLFVVYFPKVLQGPISRHKELSPQFFTPHKLDYKEFCFGLQLMLWGYFKKLVIADRLAIFVNRVFLNVTEETGAHLLVAACLAVIQLYCDFSGCMDIARGFSQILGLRLAKNFDRPFFSKSAAEFWRRWHITLGTWFKDYIYMPLVISPKLLGVSKKLRDKFGPRAGKAFMAIVPLTAVWLLTGIWHGTGWNYITWGLYWGALIIASTIFAPEIKTLTQKLKINTEAWSWQLFQMVRTFGFFVFGHILVISNKVILALVVFKRILLMFHPENLFDGSLYTLGLDRPNFLMSLVFIGVLWAVSMLQKKSSVREQLANSNLVFRWVIYYALFFAIVIFGIYGPGYDAASFVYEQF